jgi:hypothetical protein
MLGGQGVVGAKAPPEFKPRLEVGLAQRPHIERLNFCYQLRQPVKLRFGEVGAEHRAGDDAEGEPGHELVHGHFERATLARSLAHQRCQRLHRDVVH